VAELPPDSLTPREREVLTLLITGCPNKQIAAQAKLSEMTVKVHRSQIMRKMAAGAASRPWCWRLGACLKREAEGWRQGGRKAALPSPTPDAKAQKNFTDPESRIMKSKDGFVQAYNAQIAVDAEAQIIVAQDVTQSASDCGETKWCARSA
jgi:hypothetical protein